ncbi:MAG TPA: pentapeptide repeat-containing protein [Anaerolineae bacterium]|nr:pentapeptide repeat-containing protein [Anaerolineae bacterium]
MLITLSQGPLWLARANLEGAHLVEVDLEDANLEGVNLRATDLCRANLKGAIADADEVNRIKVA